MALCYIIIGQYCQPNIQTGYSSKSGIAYAIIVRYVKAQHYVIDNQSVIINNLYTVYKLLIIID